MSLDSILGVLFFVVFVVVPLVSGSRRAGRGVPPAQRPRPGAGPQPSPGQPGDDPAAEVTAMLEEVRRRVAEAQRREQEERARRRGQAGRGPADRAPAAGPLVSSPERRIGETGTFTSASLGPEGTPAPRVPPPVVLGPEGAFPDPYQQGGYVLGREGVPSAAAPAGRAQQASSPTWSAAKRSASLGREGSAGWRTGSVPAVRPTVGVALGSVEAGEIGASRRRVGERPGGDAAGARLGRAGALRFDEDSVVAGLIWHEVLSRPRALRHWRER